MKQSIGLGRGSVYNIIMKALQTGDKYGYEICQEIETKTNGSYILKQPSLYSGLKRLEAKKLVSSYWGDSDIGGRRHYYKLTPAGIEKIENSNFSWNDDRNEIINTFFKESEIDKQISSIKTDVEDIKEQVISDKKENDEAQNILSSDNSSTLNHNTENITNEESVKLNQNNKPNSNSFGHKISENQFDLFSFNSNLDEEKNSEQELKIGNVNSNDIVEEKNNLQESKQDKIAIEKSNVFDADKIYQNDELKETISTINENANENSSINFAINADNGSKTSERFKNQNENINDVVTNKTIKTSDVELSEKTDINESKEENISTQINDVLQNNQQEKEIVENDINNIENKVENEFVNQEDNNKTENIQNEQLSLENGNAKEEINYPTQKFNSNNVSSISKNNDIDDFAQFYKNKKSNSFSETIEKSSSTPLSMSDLEKSSTFYGSIFNESTDNENEDKTNLTDDDFDKRYEMFTKMFEEENENSEKQSKNSSKNNNDQLQKERFMSDVLSGDLHKSSEEEQVINQQDLQNETINNNEQTEIEKINLKSIFGDVMQENSDNSSHNFDGNQNIKSSNIDNFSNNSINFQNENSVEETNLNEKSYNNGKTLPRYDVLNNVNLSLSRNENKNDGEYYSSNHHNYHNENTQKYYGPFNENGVKSESINTSEKSSNNTNKNIQSFSNQTQSFDKKCAEKGYGLNDYQIRYLRKNNIDESITKFTSINKLNVLVCGLFSLFALLFSILSFAICKQNGLLTSVQTVCFVLGFIAPFAYFSFYLYAYLKNKDKRIIFKFEKDLFVNSLFLGILFIIVLFCTNLLFGMKFSNIDQFIGSFVIFSVYSLVIILLPLIKPFFTKIPYFNK